MSTAALLLAAVMDPDTSFCEAMRNPITPNSRHSPVRRYRRLRLYPPAWRRPASEGRHGAVDRSAIVCPMPSPFIQNGNARDADATEPACPAVAGFCGSGYAGSLRLSSGNDLGPCPNCRGGSWMWRQWRRLPLSFRGIRGAIDVPSTPGDRCAEKVPPSPKAQVNVVSDVGP